MSPKAPPMDLSLANALVEWYDHGELFPLEVGGRKRTVLAIPPGPVLDHLRAVLRQHQLVVSPRGWAVREEMVKEEIERARSVIHTYVFGEMRQAAATLQTQALASTLEPEPPVKPAEDDPDGLSWDRPDDAVEWPLCDRNRIDTLLDTIPSRDHRRPVLDRWKQRPWRWLPRTTEAHVAAVAALEEDFPNFGEVIRGLRGHLSRRALCEQPLQLSPLLLLGPPGVGKTAFGKRLAEVLGAHLEFQSLAELTAGFTLTGMTQGWAGGAPGLIARSLLELPDGQPPVLLFDELDKARQDTTHPTDAALLGLLDPVSSEAFRDEFLELPLDITPVSFLFTANRTRGIRPELLSRLQVIEVPSPTAAQMPAIVRSVDAAVRTRQPQLADHFAPLGDSLINTLASQSPRALMRLLNTAYDRAAAEALSRKHRKRRFRLHRRHLELASNAIPPAGDRTTDCHDPGDGPILVLPKGPERVH